MWLLHHLEPEIGDAIDYCMENGYKTEPEEQYESEYGLDENAKSKNGSGKPPLTYQQKLISKILITTSEEINTLPPQTKVLGTPIGVKPHRRKPRPCDLNLGDPRTRFVKALGSLRTEDARMKNSARVRKCCVRVAAGSKSLGVDQLASLKNG